MRLQAGPSAILGAGSQASFSTGQGTARRHRGQREGMEPLQKSETWGEASRWLLSSSILPFWVHLGRFASGALIPYSSPGRRGRVTIPFEQGKAEAWGRRVGCPGPPGPGLGPVPAPRGASSPVLGTSDLTLRCPLFV